MIKIEKKFFLQSLVAIEFSFEFPKLISSLSLLFHWCFPQNIFYTWKAANSFGVSLKGSTKEVLNIPSQLLKLQNTNYMVII